MQMVVAVVTVVVVAVLDIVFVFVMLATSLEGERKFGRRATITKSI